MKKVIFLLIDSLMPNILEDCIRHRTVPALQYLITQGKYWPDCVTVFPTMTASVDSSLVTGVYPDKHRIPGLIWYSPEERSIVDYINGWKCVWRIGLSKCLNYVLYDLNEKHLSKETTTIFEELARLGKTTASINAVVHRGKKRHKVSLPFLLDLITGFRFREDVTGPEILTLGSLISSEAHKAVSSREKRLTRRLGINDAFAVQVVIDLIKSGNQPDFMLVYLPDNDHEVHKQNPAHAETALLKVDQQIQEILNSFPSWEEAIDQCVFIVTSDHGQTRIGKEKTYNIDLDQLFKDYSVLQLNENTKDHDLAIANNERMAYVYPFKEEKTEDIKKRLIHEARIDVIAWKEDFGVRVVEGGSGRSFYYKPGGPIKDPYGVNWNVIGEYQVMDLKMNQNSLQYGDYPDGLSRLYGALYSQDIPMIVITARPRFEFKTRYFPMHLNGGSHGSLHKYDSLIPLIITGTDLEIKSPPRLIDLKEIILNMFIKKPDGIY